MSSTSTPPAFPTISILDCTIQTCPMSEGEVQYIPTLAGNITYLSIFALLLLSQIVLGIFYRTWGFLVGMTCGLVLEVLGYIGRVLLHQNPFRRDYFLLYFICVAIGPAFFSASIYLCLGRLIVVYGETMSRLKPRTYALIFIICDFFSLVLQAVGGGITATSTTESSIDLGIHIMLAGLSSQVLSLLIFLALGGEFALRVKRARDDSTHVRFVDLRKNVRFSAFQCALILASLFIFVRCVYRIAELNGGFRGKIANNQVLFMVFEGPVIIIAITLMTISHPGIGFSGAWQDANWSLRNSKAGRASNELIRSGHVGTWGK